MEDNYLDKRFKEILENPPQMEPPDAAIEDMRRRLTGEGEQQKTGFVLPLWWPLLLGIPLLLSGVFFFQKNQTLNQRFDELNLQLTEIQKDTLINKTVIYQIDTIYNIIYKDVIIERRYEQMEGLVNEAGTPSIFSKDNFNLFGKNSGEESNLWIGGAERSHFQSGFFLQSNIAQSNKFGLKNPTHPLLSDKEVMDVEVSKNIAALDFLDLKYLTTDGLAANLTDKLNDAKPPILKPKKNPIYYFQPVGASIGIHAAPYLSANLPDGFVPGNAFGISAEIHFIKNFHLRLGVERLGVKFELKDDGIGTLYPITNPDDPLDVLHELKGNLSYLQIPIELKKRFRDGKVFQPYFQFGLVAVRPLIQDFRYEYINSSGEYKKRQKLKNGAFTVDHFRGGFGGEFLFAKKYYAGIGAYYQHGLSIGEGEYFKLRYWGLQANFRYQLF